MKSIKNSKASILAVLALALALGVAAPTATFASEGSETTGGETTDTGTAGADKKEEASYSVAESIVELNKRITENDSFKAYRDAEGLVSVVQTAENYLKPVKDLGKDPVGFSSLTEAQKTELSDLNSFDYYPALKKALGSEISEELNKDIAMEELATSMTLVQLQAEVKKLINPTTDGNIDDATPQALVDAAKTLPNYGKFAALYSAMGFVRGMTAGSIDNPEGTMLTVDLINATFAGKYATLSGNYKAMAKAAVAIDPKAADGLAEYEEPGTLPDTSTSNPDEKPVTKPTTPNTGIAGLIEAGALDMEAVLLIGAAVVTLVAGAGVIARLYLHRKF